MIYSFNDGRREATLTGEEIQAITGATERSIRRWENTHGWPRAERQLCQHIALGRILPKPWYNKGFTFNDDGDLANRVKSFHVSQIDQFDYALQNEKSLTHTLRHKLDEWIAYAAHLERLAPVAPVVGQIKPTQGQVLRPEGAGELLSPRKMASI